MMNMKKLSLREFAEVVAALMNKNGMTCFVDTHSADGQMALTCMKGNMSATASVDDLWRKYSETETDIQNIVQTMSIAFSEALNNKNQDTMNIAAQTQDAVQNIPQNPQFTNPRTANTMSVMPRAAKTASTCQCGNGCSSSCGSQRTNTGSMKPISEFLESLMKDIQSQMDNASTKKHLAQALKTLFLELLVKNPNHSQRLILWKSCLNLHQKDSRCRLLMRHLMSL